MWQWTIDEVRLRGEYDPDTGNKTGDNVVIDFEWDGEI
jgi:hypothetical protein